MATKNPKSFNSSQELLVTICLAAWTLCNKYLAQFAAFAGYYTAQYIADQEAAIAAAKALPTAKETAGARKSARTVLKNAAKQVLTDWQLLKQYITNAYDADQVNIQLDIAGNSYVQKAGGNDWSSLRSLIESGNKFIEANADTLAGKNNTNMPIDFPTKFQTDSDTCTAASEAFFAADIARKEATKNKKNAYVAFYTQTITMLKNGLVIFKNDDTIKSQFSFAALTASYKGGAASLYGTITNDNGQTVEGATIISKDQKYQATSGKGGTYRIHRIAEGTHIFTCSCPGYVPVDQLITFSAGVKSKSDVKLAFSLKKVA